MKSGILADVYRNGFGDCTNGGVSSKANTVLIPLPEGGPFEDNGKWPVLILDERKEMSKRHGNDCAVFIPAELKDSGKWTMFGGNFVWTSDSRFPRRFPIPIHDRVEGC